MEQCADLANDKLSAEVSSSDHNQGMMTHLETGFDFIDIHDLHESVLYSQPITYVTCSDNYIFYIHNWVGNTLDMVTM